MLWEQPKKCQKDKKLTSVRNDAVELGWQAFSVKGQVVRTLALLTIWWLSVLQSAFAVQTAWGPVSGPVLPWDSGWCLRKLLCHWWRDTYKPGDAIQTAQNAELKKSLSSQYIPESVPWSHPVHEKWAPLMIKPLIYLDFCNMHPKAFLNSSKVKGKLNVYSFASDEPWLLKSLVFDLMEPRMRDSMEKHIKMVRHSSCQWRDFMRNFFSLLPLGIFLRKHFQSDHGCLLFLQ